MGCWRHVLLKDPTRIFYNISGRVYATELKDFLEVPREHRLWGRLRRFLVRCPPSWTRNVTFTSTSLNQGYAPLPGHPPNLKKKQKLEEWCISSSRATRAPGTRGSDPPLVITTGPCAPPTLPPPAAHRELQTAHYGVLARAWGRRVDSVFC